MATLEVLERTGIKMTHSRGLELLDGAGAKRGWRPGADSRLAG